MSDEKIPNLLPSVESYKATIGQPEPSDGQQNTIKDYYEKYKQPAGEFGENFRAMLTGNLEEQKAAFFRIAATLETTKAVNWRIEDIDSMLAGLRKQNEYMHLLGESPLAKAVYAFDEAVRQAPDKKDQLMNWLGEAGDLITSKLEEYTGLDLKVKKH